MENDCSLSPSVLHGHRRSSLASSHGPNEASSTDGADWDIVTLAAETSKKPVGSPDVLFKADGVRLSFSAFAADKSTDKSTNKGMDPDGLVLSGAENDVFLQQLIAYNDGNKIEVAYALLDGVVQDGYPRSQQGKPLYPHLIRSFHHVELLFFHLFPLASAEKEIDAQVLILDELEMLLAGNVRNLIVCERNAFLENILRLVWDAKRVEWSIAALAPGVREKLIRLIAAMGAFNSTETTLQLVCAPFSQTANEDSNADRLVSSIFAIDIIRTMLFKGFNRKKPRSFFCLDGQGGYNSALVLTMMDHRTKDHSSKELEYLSLWPKRGFTFSCWLRIDNQAEACQETTRNALASSTDSAFEAALINELQGGRQSTSFMSLSGSTNAPLGTSVSCLFSIKNPHGGPGFEILLCSKFDVEHLTSIVRDVVLVSYDENGSSTKTTISNVVFESSGDSPQGCWRLFTVVHKRGFWNDKVLVFLGEKLIYEGTMAYFVPKKAAVDSTISNDERYFELTENEQMLVTVGAAIALEGDPELLGESIADCPDATSSTPKTLKWGFHGQIARAVFFGHPLTKEQAQRLNPILTKADACLLVRPPFTSSSVREKVQRHEDLEEFASSPGFQESSKLRASESSSHSPMQQKWEGIREAQRVERKLAMKQKSKSYTELESELYESILFSWDASYHSPEVGFNRRIVYDSGPLQHNGILVSAGEAPWSCFTAIVHTTSIADVIARSNVGAIMQLLLANLMGEETSGGVGLLQVPSNVEGVSNEDRSKAIISARVVSLFADLLTSEASLGHFKSRAGFGWACKKLDMLKLLRCALVHSKTHMLTSELVLSLSSLVDAVALSQKDSSIAKEALRLLFDFKIWSSAPMHVQDVLFQVLFHQVAHRYLIVREEFGVQYLLDSLRRYYWIESKGKEGEVRKPCTPTLGKDDLVVCRLWILRLVDLLMSGPLRHAQYLEKYVLEPVATAHERVSHCRRSTVQQEDVESLVYHIQQEKGSMDIEDVLRYLVSFISRAHRAKNVQLQAHLKTLGNLLPLWQLLEHPCEQVRVKMIRLIHCYTSYTGQSSSPRPAPEIEADHKFNPLDGEFVFEQEHAERMVCSIAASGKPYSLAVNNALVGFLVDEALDVDGEPVEDPSIMDETKVICYPVLLRTILDLVAMADTDSGVQLSALQQMSQMLMLPGNPGVQNRHMFTRIAGWQQRLLQLCLPRKKSLADSRTRAVNESSLEVFSTALFHRMIGVSGGLMVNGSSTAVSSARGRDARLSSWIPNALGSNKSGVEGLGNGPKKNACIYPKEDRVKELSMAFAYLDATLYHDESLEPSTIARLRRSILVKLLTRANQLLKMAIAGIAPADAIVVKTLSELEQLILFSSVEVLVAEPDCPDTLTHDLRELLLVFWEKYAIVVQTLADRKNGSKRAFRSQDVSNEQQLRKRRDRHVAGQEEKHHAIRWKNAADLSSKQKTGDFWRRLAASRPVLFDCQQAWNRFTDSNPVVLPNAAEVLRPPVFSSDAPCVPDKAVSHLQFPLAPGGVCWQVAQVYLSSILDGVLKDDIKTLPAKSSAALDLTSRVWGLYDLIERNGFVCPVSKPSGCVRQTEVTKREPDTGMLRAVSCGEAWPSISVSVNDGSPKEGSPLTSGLGSPFESPGVVLLDGPSSPIAIPGMNLGKTSSPVMIVNNYNRPIASSESPRSKEASFVMIDEPVEVLTEDDHKRLMFVAVFVGIAIVERLDYSKATVPQPSSALVADAECSKILAMMRRGDEEESAYSSRSSAHKGLGSTAGDMEDTLLDALCQLFRLVSSAVHHHNMENSLAGTSIFFSGDWLPNPQDPHRAPSIETIRQWLDVAVVNMVQTSVREDHARFEEWQAMYREALSRDVGQRVRQQARVIKQLGERLDQRIRAFEVGGHEDEARMLRASRLLLRNDREDVRSWKEIQRDVATMPVPSSWTNLRLSDEHCYWMLDRRENDLRMRLSMKRAYKRYAEQDSNTGMGGAVTINQLSALATQRSLQESQDESGSVSGSDSTADVTSDEGKQDVKAGLSGGGDWDVVELTCAPYAARNEAVLLSLDCQLILPMHVVTGRMDISASHIYFYGDSVSPPGASTSTVVTKPSQASCERGEEISVSRDLKNWAMESQFNEIALRSRQWALDDIMEVQLRRYLLRPSALEIFFLNKKAFLFNFNERDQNRKIFQTILKQKPRFLSNRFALRKLYRPPEIIKHRYETKTELWIAGKMSNYEYLMYLNTCSGRTFNDLTQYPVFPWVLRDYTSATIDLNDPSVYRDLSKPVGALNAGRLESFRQRQAAYEPHDNEPAFLYGSHYSNVGVVLYYLLRVEPFSSFAKKLQGGKFDHADRLFHSVQKTWENCLTSSSDLKELIPEWFSLAEMFTNGNGESLGVKQDGTVIGDVVLPPWASSAEEFVRINRQALESDYVSEHLHEWIDLIFGYKQRGAEADKADNLFYHLTYEGAVDVERIDDKVTKQGIEAQIANFGQTPAQLFPTKPHPRRRKAERSPDVFVETGREAPAGVDMNEITALYFVRSPVGSEGIESLTFSKSTGMKYTLLVMDRAGQVDVFDVSLQKSAYDSEDSTASLNDVPNPLSAKVVSRSQDTLLQLHPVNLGSKAIVLLNGKALVSYGHLDCTLKVWCTQSGNLLQVVSLHSGSGRVMTVAIDEVESRLCAGSEDGTMSLWRINRNAEGTIHHLLELLKKSKAGEKRADAGQSPLLGAVSQLPKVSLKQPGETSKAPTFMDKILSVLPFQAQRSSLPSVVEASGGPEYWIVGCHKSSVDCLAISAAFDMLVTYARGVHCIHMYSVSEGRFIRSMGLPSSASVTCMHVCESGKVVVATRQETTVLYAFSINGKHVGTVDLGVDAGIAGTIRSNLRLDGCDRIIVFAENTVVILNDLLEVVQTVIEAERLSHGAISSDGRCLMVALSAKKELRTYCLS